MYAVAASQVATDVHQLHRQNILGGPSVQQGATLTTLHVRDISISK